MQHQYLKLGNSKVDGATLKDYIKSGNLDAIKEYVESNDSSVLTKHYGSFRRSLLDYAASYLHKEIVIYLLEQGASPVVYGYPKSSVHHAIDSIKKNKDLAYEIIKLLIDKVDNEDSLAAMKSYSRTHGNGDASQLILEKLNSYNIPNGKQEIINSNGELINEIQSLKKIVAE